jgi:UTP-glucose-1-phosphate uridylyltransferase/mevalonate kinase
MKLFVPGRICIFGEHSDWAGGYRRINADVEKGYTLISGTDQGIYAEVEPHPTSLVLTSTTEEGEKIGPYEIPMQPNTLLEEAQKGGYWSYIAGVAYQVLTNYHVRGLVINNYKTDLPVKKGLSSSAAISVLTARAFNRIYDLKLTIRGEMELAYMGEITTPSRCGRMDQGCAFGNRPVLMVFDGDRLDTIELQVEEQLHFVVVDLGAEKDTMEILNRLNRCYPFAENDLERGVQELLGPINKRVTNQAVELMTNAQGEQLGKLMAEAQTFFDHLGVECLELTLRPGQQVRKAVIPAAGFGTRLFPATKATKKELFPVVDQDGIAKPAILLIVEEALEAGLEEVIIIVQEDDLEDFRSFFNAQVSIENFNKLPPHFQEYAQRLLEIGRRVTFVTQQTQQGFGHAVYSAREAIGDEPFLLMLGDHLYRASEGNSCAKQLLDAYKMHGLNVLGLRRTPEDQIANFGTVAGVWIDEERLLNVTEFAEKPTVDYARNNLLVPGLAADEYLTVFGLYIIKPQLFDYLEEHIENNVRERGEFQLTSALDSLRRDDGFMGLIMEGRRYDIGLPQYYLDTLKTFVKKGI